METENEFKLEGRSLFLDYTGSRATKPSGDQQSFGDSKSGELWFVRTVSMCDALKSNT